MNIPDLWGYTRIRTIRNIAYRPRTFGPNFDTDHDGIRDGIDANPWSSQRRQVRSYHIPLEEEQYK